ncbi:MAG: nitronate monooxygenase family protein [Alphaproteobacteria bacterium]|uniref:Nitronate monooxygenase family protein n=1 Tax=Candidatus Nitrobium versatile TaxID=2884831 RepID=A0A953M292_9BACT|nr:nitronate monooxygenase family protein [Candidatus Nitrobium versatile]
MPETSLPPLVIKGKKIPVPVIQGGMGVGVSLSPLASAVAREGGLGIVSSACLDRLVSKRTGKRANTYEAAYEEVSRSKAGGGLAGINIMGALVRDYNDSVRGALDAGADAIISGAGLPLTLPVIQPPKDTALIPIVSSTRALEIICKKWEKLGYRPDAIVLEGPLAGGHLGFKMEQLDLEANSLENLLPPVKDMAIKYGNFPVIVAGGIYTYEDIVKFMKMGADGVQMGTRFLATEESSASPEYKQAVIAAREEDIVVAHDPGSPCGLPFRVIKHSPMYVSSLKRLRPPKCDKGYVLLKDKEGAFTICPAKESNEHHFCICNGLLSSAGYNPDKEEPLYTVGTNASRVDRVLSVRELMDEITGHASCLSP